MTHGAVVNGAFGAAYTSNNTCPNGGFCGDYAGGGNGPLGSSLDNVSCQNYMSNNYHIHVFVGIYYNGQEMALPTATGMANPRLDSNYDDMTTSGFYPCVYDTHTHDMTGVVHIESNNGGIAETVPNDSKFTLGQYFAVWGINVYCPMGTGCVGQFGSYSGPMEIFTTGQQYRGDVAVTPEQDLTPWYGDPGTIPLYSHEVIWILIGPNYPTTLPGISFDEQF